MSYSGTRSPRRDAPYLIAGIVLFLSALAFAWTLAPRPISSPPLFPYFYAQGYFAEYPRVGVARVVPLAKFALKSPAAQSRATPQ